MAALNIGGRRVTVDDSFLKLSPEEQNSAVEEIASSFAAEPSVAGDVAKSVATAVPKTAINLTGLPGMASDLVGRGVNALGNLVTGKTGSYEDFQQKRAKALGGADITAPTPQAIRSTVESATGPLYESKTPAGRLAGAGTESALTSMLFPGGLAANAAVGAASGVAGEGASQIAEQYAPELAPAAGIAASMLTGGLASAIPNAAARKAASKLVPTPESNLAAGSTKFEEVKNMGVTFDPTAVSKGLGDIKKQLKDEFGKNDLIKPVLGQLESWKKAYAPGSAGPMSALTKVTPTQKAPVDVSDLQNLRSQLGKQAEALDPTLRRAAQTAQGQVDDLIGSLASVAPLPQNHAVINGVPHHLNPNGTLGAPITPTYPAVVSGDAKKAAQLLEDARADWSAGRRGQTVAGRIELGENNQITSGAGDNINSGRKAVKTLVSPNMSGVSQAQKRGFNTPEQDQMKLVMRGDKAVNALRFLGGSGFIPGAVPLAGVTGYTASGDPSWMLALPAVYGAKALAGSLTKRQERLLQEMVNKRNSTAGYQITAPPKRLSANTTGALLGLQRAQSLLYPDDEGSD